MTKPQNKIAGLQVARAFAALSIAYFHSKHALLPFPAGTSHPIPFLIEYGWVAVDFFFAISGYVICMVVTRPNFNRGDFLIRRVFRLYPLWIVTSLIFLFLSMRYLGMPPTATPSFIGYSFTLLPTPDFPFYDLGWSLQHEIAFYLVAALIAPRFGLRGLVIFMTAATIISALFDLPWYLEKYTFYYPTFIAGILAFAAHNYFKQLNAWVLLVAGFGLLWFFTIYIGRQAFPIALFFALLGFVNLKIRSGSITEKVGVLLGDASYSIYLIHSLVFSYVYVTLQTPLPPLWSQELIRFGAIAITCFLAIASWKLLETPTIKLGNVIARALRQPAPQTT